MPRCYSKKYDYMIKYHPKSGCTIFRHLFLELHKDEISPDVSHVTHHVIEKLFPYNNQRVPFKLHLVRNPYTRVVSMFTNKMCSRGQGILNNTIIILRN